MWYDLLLYCPLGFTMTNRLFFQLLSIGAAPSFYRCSSLFLQVQLPPLVVSPLLPLLQVLLRLLVLLLLLMFLHRLLRMIQTFDVRWIMSWLFRRLKDRFWWTFWMRLKDCEQIWHGFEVLHHHLLLIMDFDCPLAFLHKKGKYTYEIFWHTLYLFLFLGGEFIFFWLVGACGVI